MDFPLTWRLLRNERLAMTLELKYGKGGKIELNNSPYANLLQGGLPIRGRCPHTGMICDRRIYRLHRRVADPAGA